MCIYDECTLFYSLLLFDKACKKDAVTEQNIYLHLKVLYFLSSNMC